MTDDPKPAFEFDPLPGDPNAPAPEKPPAKDKKKTKRKKRGPRRVVTGVTITNGGPGAGASTAEVTTAPAKSERKKRTPKPERPPEFLFIKQFMDLTEPTRKRVLAALNEIFG